MPMRDAAVADMLSWVEYEIEGRWPWQSARGAEERGAKTEKC
jgi:hypothetical protein